MEEDSDSGKRWLKLTYVVLQLFKDVHQGFLYKIK